MTPFEVVKASFYNRCAHGPYTPKVHQLLTSDISPHLPVIQYFAEQCEHCTEFGTREGQSTTALLAGCKGIVHSYDIQRTSAADLFGNMQLPCKWVFHQENTLMAEIEETDFLFIDADHTYKSCSQELTKHGRKARKFIGWHDTMTCFHKNVSSDTDPNEEGIGRAILEFLEKYKDEYKTVYRTDWCNGLWIMEKI